MSQIYQHFQEEAESFDTLIHQLIPRYDEMLQTIADALPFPTGAPIQVIDLGSGTGLLAARIRERFPCARLTCIDADPAMLALARRRFENDANVRFEAADFGRYEFPTAAPYEAAVSSLALHHLPTDASKIDFYAKAFRALAPGGVFLIGDAVLAATPHWQELHLERWREFIQRSIPADEVENKWMRLHREEDFPAPLLRHLEWLGTVGFIHPDVLWKEHYMAVFGAVKP